MTITHRAFTEDKGPGRKVRVEIFFNLDLQVNVQAVQTQATACINKKCNTRTQRRAVSGGGVGCAIREKLFSEACLAVCGREFFELNGGRN